MLVNQNVNAANFLLVSSQAGNSVPSKEELTGSVGFADVLQNTSNQQTSNVSLDVSSKKDDVKVSSKVELSHNDMKTSSKQETTEAKKADETNASKETTDATDAQDEKVENNTQTDETKVESDVTEKTEETDVTQVVEGLEELSQEDMEVILETIGNLLYEVMQQFDLSLEELSAKLETFGMEPSDLLTQDGLKDFFLQMNGADVSDLIVDENLNQELQAFIAQISDEVATLETLIPDVKKFVSSKDVAQMFSELMTTQDEEFVAPVVAKPMEEVVIADEPEVIVNNEQSTSVNVMKENETSDSNNQQTKDSLQQTHQDSTTIEQSTVKTQTFENPILQAIQNAMNHIEATVVTEQQVQQTDILRQVVEQVRVNMNQQQTSLELQLYPEHLGRIQINVVSKEGVMTASIVAETEAAKQAIEAGLLNLKEAMEQQDLKVEAIEVMVSTMGFEQSDEQQQSFDEKGSSNPRRKINLSELGEEITVEDEAEIEKMKATGSSVSYRA